jgi:hypothetical protein
MNHFAKISLNVNAAVNSVKLLYGIGTDAVKSKSQSLRSLHSKILDEYFCFQICGKTILLKIGIPILLKSGVIFAESEKYSQKLE